MRFNRFIISVNKIDRLSECPAFMKRSSSVGVHDQSIRINQERRQVLHMYFAKGKHTVITSVASICHHRITCDVKIEEMNGSVLNTGERSRRSFKGEMKSRHHTHNNR